MKLTITTLFITTLHLVLARTPAVAAVALPPVMAAFPFIPVLAYTLLLSVFSYISTRILRYFNLSPNLLTFLRRKGRLPNSSVNNVHELLPTSAAVPLPTPPIGIYPDSSNVNLPRSASLDNLPPHPIRLISPASSPPPRLQNRHATTPSFVSFSILKPTAYSHKHRRSHSLGIPIPRPEAWPVQFPPSPPVIPQHRDISQHDIKDDEIPLAFLSPERAAVQPKDVSDIPPHTGILNTSPPTAPAPLVFTPDIYYGPSIHGPLIDISPSLSNSSTSHSSAPETFSSSSSALPPHTISSFRSGDSSPSNSSGSMQYPNPELRHVGGIEGFAYDWGFRYSHDYPEPSGDVYGQDLFSPISLSCGGTHTTVLDDKVDNNVPVDQIKGPNLPCATQEVGQQGKWIVLDEPSISGNSEDTGHAADIKGDLSIEGSDPGRLVTSTSQLVLSPENNQIQPLSGQSVSEPEQELFGDDSEAQVQPAKEAVIQLSVQEKARTSIIPPLIIEDVPTVEVSSMEIPVSPSRSLPLPSPCSPPSQTPTPPASPPFVPTPLTSTTGANKVRSISVDSTVDSPSSETREDHEPGRLQVQATSDVSDVLIGNNDLEGMQLVKQECELVEEIVSESQIIVIDVQRKGDKDPNVDCSVGTTALDNTSPTSPTGIRPAWSIRAAVAPPLGLSAAMAAEVQEEVAWPKKSENKGQKDETPLQNLQREPPHKPIEITLDTEVETRSDPVASDDAVSASLSPTFPAPTCDLEPSLPGTFIQVESSQTVPQPKSPIPRPPAILTPGTFNLSRRRTARRTLPIDVALAMQMRPGLGVGADPAWMVRFLMAVFSWFAIMVAGRGGEVDVYAL